MSDKTEGQGISRRAALGVMAGAGVGLGVGLGPAGAAAEGEAPSGKRQTIMFIRHGEKPDGPGKPFGITPDGEQDIESLSVRGWQRSGGVAQLFAPVSNAGRRVPTPDSLVASDPGKKGSKRPLQTITPLAEKLGKQVALMKVDDEVADLAKIAQALAATPGVTLSAWPHDYIPGITAQLGKVNPPPPAKWAGARYDVVWVFTRQPGGSWKFSQVPQLLLAGDLATVMGSTATGGSMPTQTW